ncbi:MAG: hypothetical protein ACYTG5_21580 [Planctomycetota bacterium]|jgi:hypothetical protein
MKKRWPIVIGILVWTCLSAGIGYAFGECPERAARLSPEALEQIAAACKQDCADPCPAVPPCPACELTCPQIETPDCPEPGDVLILPSSSIPSYRLEALVLAGEESWGAGAVWRPRKPLLRLTSVGIVYQDISSQEASYGLSGAYPCWQHGHHDCGGWSADGTVRTGGADSWSVVATIGLW